MQRCRESQFVSSLQRRAERGRRVQGYWSGSCGMVSLGWTFPCSCIFRTLSVRGLHVNTCFIFPASCKGSWRAEGQRPEIQYEPKASEEIKNYVRVLIFIPLPVPLGVCDVCNSKNARKIMQKSSTAASFLIFFKPFDSSIINSICQGFLFS